MQNIIENSCILPFFVSPTTLHVQSNKSSKRDRHFVSEAITKLLNSNYIDELSIVLLQRIGNSGRGAGPQAGFRFMPC